MTFNYTQVSHSRRQIALAFLFISFYSFSLFAQVTEKVVGWQNPYTYEDATNFYYPKADSGIAANIGISVIRTYGGVSASIASDAYGTLNTSIFNNYTGGTWQSGNGTKYWGFSCNTMKYGTLKFSTKLAGSSTSGTNFYGPRDFKLQYSTNNSTWFDVTGGAITAGAATASTLTFNSLTNITLPAACENQSTLYLRLIMTSNTAVGGGSITTGYSYLDDVFVTGVTIAEAPTDIALSTSSVICANGVSVPSATTIGTLSSVDFNIGNTFTYTLASGVGDTDNSLFTISGNTLSTNSTVNAGTYSIRVRSTDNSDLYFDEVFSIKVVPKNEILYNSTFRTSFMGSNGNTSYNATNPTLAFNSVNNEFFSVWKADDNTSPSIDNEYEIYGQRINASTGSNIGSRVKISAMGTSGTTTFVPNNPAIAYDSTDNEYLVVWSGSHNSGSLVTGENEIWGQRIKASDGSLLGTMFRISTMGADGSTTYNATSPSIAWNATNNKYLVVWRADNNANSTVDNEYDMYSQLITNTGTLSGSMLQVSQMGGGNGNTTYNVVGAPSLAWNATNNNFLVVWRADDNSNGLIDNENEIFGQLLTNTNTLSGSKVQISFMGGSNGNTSFAANTPSVAWNSTDNQYLVVWSGDDNTSPLVDNENEIFGQRLSSSLALVGSRIRISDMGTDGSTSFTATAPSVCYNQALNEYWVIWQGDDNETSVDNETEVFLQRVNNNGVEVGDNDIRVTYAGTNGSTTYSISNPVLSYNSITKNCLVVWSGDDNTSPLVDNENEIFGQLLFRCGVTLTNTNTIASGSIAENEASSFTTSNCNLVASVQSKGGTPVAGGVDTKVWIQSSQPATHVKRHYEITPQLNPNTATASITLYYTQADFDDYNAMNPSLRLPSSSGDAVGKSNIRIHKISGTSSDGSGSMDSYSGAKVIIDPDDSKIVWNSELSRWEVTFDVTGFSGFFTSTNTSLPVNLLSFNGMTESSKNILSWITASEIDNKGFEIQRSFDGHNFNAIGYVNGKGTIDQQQNYSFTEPQPNASVSYYRLKQEDNGGGFSYSKVLALNRYDGMVDFSIFPNPSSSIFNLVGKSIEDRDAIVINTLGQVFSIKVKNNQIDLGHLPNGFYYFKLNAYDRSVKLIKE